MVLDSAWAGKGAALGAAFLWAITVTVFTFASRRVGAQVVNATRLALATLLLLGLQWAFTGHPWPPELGGARVAWLLVSGLVGFAVSDGLGLESFMRIGPRQGMLVQTLAPVFSSLLGWGFLGQTLSLGKAGAIALTLSGIALVVTQAPAEPAPKGHRLAGVLFGIGAALGQALGQLAAIRGMAGGVPAVGANVLRLAAGTAGILLWLALRGGLRGMSRPWGDGKALAQIGLGTLVGPIGGVLLALYAMTHAPLAVAATLMYLVPVFLLPLGRVFFREPITPRAILGTLLTVGGAALLIR